MAAQRTDNGALFHADSAQALRGVVCGEIQAVLMQMRRSARWARMRQVRVRGVRAALAARQPRGSLPLRPPPRARSRTRRAQNPSQSSWTELVYKLKLARRTVASCTTPSSSVHYIPAFLDVVRSEQTSGDVTEAALSAVHKLLQLDVLGAAGAMRRAPPHRPPSRRLARAHGAPRAASADANADVACAPRAPPRRSRAQRWTTLGRRARRCARSSRRSRTAASRRPTRRPTRSC